MPPPECTLQLRATIAGRRRVLALLKDSRTSAPSLRPASAPAREEDPVTVQTAEGKPARMTPDPLASQGDAHAPPPAQPAAAFPIATHLRQPFAACQLSRERARQRRRRPLTCSSPLRGTSATSNFGSGQAVPGCLCSALSRHTPFRPGFVHTTDATPSQEGCTSPPLVRAKLRKAQFQDKHVFQRGMRVDFALPAVWRAAFSFVLERG